MKRILFHSENYQSVALNLALLFFRLGFGLIMALSHGLSKFPVQPGFVEKLGSMGFPMPTAMAWAACLSELLGGLFIALGLATRISAASLAITMAVAFFIVHGADGFQVKEMAFLYLIGYVFIFIAGPGKYSVDGMISNQ